VCFGYNFVYLARMIITLHLTSSNITYATHYFDPGYL